MWDQIKLAVSACGNHVRDRANCQKRFDDIRANLKKKIQAQRMHASATGGGPPAQSLMLTPLEEQMREKFLPVVVEGLAGDRDIGIYSAQFPPEPDVAAQGQIHSSDHEDVDTPGLTQHSSPPARDTYSAIAASEERILGEENRRHSEISVLERMMSLHERMHERSISEMSQIKKVIIQVPKEIQNVNRTLQTLVLNVSQANPFRSTAREQQFHFTPSEDGSLHAATFSPESSVLHSPVLDDTGTVGASSVQVPVNIQPLTSVQNMEPTPTKETRKRKLGQQLLITSFWKKIKTQKQEKFLLPLLHFVTATRCEIAALWKQQEIPIIPKIRNRIWHVCRMEQLTSLVNDSGTNFLKVWDPWLTQEETPGVDASSILH
ncbi:uncharacterized protein LOC142487430 [Ascaphus truei]|uniref:uncharacterized protein LOC142487430 n=1 Tax=Ascaphus truei TaxID=8439 RepID=UPI003F59F320